MNFLLFFSLLIILFYFLIIFFFLKEILYFSSVFFGAPFVSASEDKVEEILKLLDLRPGEILYDLGSGDGRIIIEAVRKYQVRAVGIEINPLLVYFSRRKIRKLGLQDRVKVYFGNFFKKNISEADAVYIYLVPLALKRLEKKFLAELKPRTKIVSLSFPFKNIPFIKSDSHNLKIRLYQIPT